MKLINKFTLWYLCITLTCTIAGTAITFYSVKKRMTDASVERLRHINDQAAQQIQAGKEPAKFVGACKVSVDTLAAGTNNTAFIVEEKEEPNPITKLMENRLVVTSRYNINQQSYNVASYDYVTRADQILSGLEASIFWKWLIILSLIAITAGIVSRIILSPFNKTLNIIESFSLKKREELQLPQTGTKEFKRLNEFVKKMTDKATEDYASIKEFAENASHELQTPVAVMRGKLELLAESKLDEDQARLIGDIQVSLEKLSRINSSLTLLTKLDNHEYETAKPLCISKLVTETQEAYTELIEMKNLQLRTSIVPDVFITLHPLLAELLLNNLVSNAIRHNIPAGSIHIKLDNAGLHISNTGRKPEVPTEELFKRFKKSNQCDDSIGIGLAVVKQICDKNSFNIEYVFEKGEHIVTVYFPESGTVVEPAAQVVEEEIKWQPVLQNA